MGWDSQPQQVSIWGAQTHKNSSNTPCDASVKEEQVKSSEYVAEGKCNSGCGRRGEVGSWRSGKNSSSWALGDRIGIRRWARGFHRSRHSLGKGVEAGRADGAPGGQSPALGVSVLPRQVRYVVNSARSVWTSLGLYPGPGMH